TLVDPNDPTPIFGHEGNWAPDGTTYYGADVLYNPVGSVPGNQGRYYAIDTTDTTRPKVITTWQTGVPKARYHGLTVSDDGTRGYFVSPYFATAATLVSDLIDPSVPASNGLLVYDLSDIQARRPNPKVKLISSLLWKDGANAQHTINVKIKGRPYLVFVDE